ncbi:surface protease GP63, putative, partial [Trypanosoma cruzi]
MNLLTENRHCEGDVVSSAHGDILENEVVTAAVQLHADRPFVQPLEGPLIVPPFATSSVCSWFTVSAGHCSTGVANAGMVRNVAGVRGGALDDCRHGSEGAPRLRRNCW